MSRPRVERTVGAQPVLLQHRLESAPVGQSVLVAGLPLGALTERAIAPGEEHSYIPVGLYGIKLTLYTRGSSNDPSAAAWR